MAVPDQETELATGPGGCVLTNCNVWSPDSAWIVFDTRSDPAGSVFDGRHIKMANADTGEVQTLYESQNGACCGVATWHPIEPKVAFILGPEFPTPDWSYGPTHRQGVIVDARLPGMAMPLDARDLVSPFTPGALRGGSHVHVWHPAGDWLSFTYDDALEDRGREIAVGMPDRPVTVPMSHPRNHDGSHFCRVVVASGDRLLRACEEAWVGTTRTLAFQGEITSGYREVFVADGSKDGFAPRQLTDTSKHKHPGLRGPRHWLRSNPAGTRIGFLKLDEFGTAQFWTVSPDSGEPVQVTRGPHPVASAFTWHPDGRHVAFIMNSAVSLCDVETGDVRELTGPTDDPIRPEACVVSPDGTRIAFVRHRNGRNVIWIVQTE